VSVIERGKAIAARTGSGRYLPDATRKYVSAEARALRWRAITLFPLEIVQASQEFRHRQLDFGRHVMDRRYRAPNAGRRAGGPATGRRHKSAAELPQAANFTLKRCRKFQAVFT